jgi:hypothetical protein
MPLNRYSTAVHAFTLMKEMKPGECFDIPADTLDDMTVPLDHPFDRPDARYKIDRLQRWLPFETEVMVYVDSGTVTFCRPSAAQSR